MEGRACGYIPAGRVDCINKGARVVRLLTDFLSKLFNHGYCGVPVFPWWANQQRERELRMKLAWPRFQTPTLLSKVFLFLLPTVDSPWWTNAASALVFGENDQCHVGFQTYINQHWIGRRLFSSQLLAQSHTLTERCCFLRTPRNSTILTTALFSAWPCTRTCLRWRASLVLSACSNTIWNISVYFRATTLSTWRCIRSLRLPAQSCSLASTMKSAKKLFPSRRPMNLSIWKRARLRTLLAHGLWQSPWPSTCCSR